MVWNIPLASSGQLSWLCSLLAFYVLHTAECRKYASLAEGKHYWTTAKTSVCYQHYSVIHCVLYSPKSVVLNFLFSCLLVFCCCFTDNSCNIKNVNIWILSLVIHNEITAVKIQIWRNYFEVNMTYCSVLCGITRAGKLLKISRYLRSSYSSSEYGKH